MSAATPGGGMKSPEQVAGEHIGGAIERLARELINVQRQRDSLAKALEEFGEHPAGCGIKIGYERREGIARIWSAGPCTCPIGVALRLAGRLL